MANFTAEVFQNEYLAEGGTDVHAIVTVTCSDAGVAGGTGGGSAAEIIIVDCSGSMDSPSSKIRAARQAAAAAVDEISDGVMFAVIAGTDRAQLVFPDSGGSRWNESAPSMVRMDSNTRRAAKAAVQDLSAGGGTVIGSWLDLATDTFATVEGSQCHAILLTDGQDGDAGALDRGVNRATGKFQCDCRGVGSDWEVAQLRKISTALMGTVDIIADPKNMADDFKAMMKGAMSRGVPDVGLRVWTPQGSQTLFARQVSPTVDDLTPRRVQVSDLISEFPTGSWADESRDFHVAIRVPAKPVGSEQLAARVSIVVADQPAAQALVKAIWSGDESLTTRINPEVAHYTGQAELAEAIQEGLAAKAAGDEETATNKLGRAVQLAAETGNEEATNKLKKVVDVEDAATGKIQLKRDVDKLDEMALDTASTKTTRLH